jgi:hypothetical protein
VSYPLVRAKFDYGARKAPVLAFVVHMAEGGNTVQYLANDPARGVSVHYVIETSGRIVQMLPESHASGSINPKELRTSDDADGFYGYTAAKAALGDWWRDPNSAVISLEIEGFAAQGPNDKQAAALVALVNDVRSRFPSIVLLGHRDFTTTKACPGRHIDWPALGGHGETDLQTTVTVTAFPARPFTSKAGLTSLRRFNATGELSSIKAPYSASVDADIAIDQSDNRVPHGPGFLRLASGGSAGYYVLAAQVDLGPTNDPVKQAVNAALDHVAPTVAAAQTAIDEARIR